MTDQRAALDPAASDPALAAWHRLWLQAHEPAPSTDLVRLELAAFRARLDAVRHLTIGPGAGMPDDVPSPTELMEQVIARTPGPTGGVVPALVATGRPELRIERSRPGWRLSGVASVLAPPAQTVSGSARLASFAIDEGDNEVLVVVALDAPGVRVEPGAAAGREVVFSGVELTDDEVVSGLHEYAVLQDQVAVHVLNVALEAAGSLAPAGRWTDELAVARASMRAAAEASGRPQLTQRSTAVSSAVALVMPLCESIAAANDFTSSEANEIRAAAAYLCAPWHLTRLAALL